MEKLEIVWRVVVTSLAVWRFFRLLFGSTASEGRSLIANAEPEDSAGGRFWAARALESLCWLSVLVSSRTAVWVACGFAGVGLIWSAIAGVVSMLPQRTDHGMQANHG